MLTGNAWPGCEAGDSSAFQTLHHLLTGHQQQQLCSAVSPDVILHAMTPASITVVMGTSATLHPSWPTRQQAGRKAGLSVYISKRLAQFLLEGSSMYNKG